MLAYHSGALDGSPAYAATSAAGQAMKVSTWTSTMTGIVDRLTQAAWRARAGIGARSPWSPAPPLGLRRSRRPSGVRGGPAGHRARGVQRIVAFELVGELVKQIEALGCAPCLREGDGPVQSDDGRRHDRHEPLVEPDDGRPVGDAVCPGRAAQCLDGCLKLER